MQKWACGVNYVGSRYYGWQKQLDIGPTVEQVLTDALQSVANHTISLVCAGRTDRGVHAVGQVVHFVSSSNRTADNWLQGVNRLLPHDVKLQWVVPVVDEFHARYSALKRRYCYVIYNHRVYHPMLSERAWWVRRDILSRCEKMQTAADYWLGTHDFSSFQAADCQAKHPTRCLNACRVVARGRFCLIHVEANAFLHHMVRNMVGVLIEIGLGNKAAVWALDVLKSCDRSCAGITVPADGLYLSEVVYDDQWLLPNQENTDPVWSLLQGGE